MTRMSCEMSVSLALLVGCFACGCSGNDDSSKAGSGGSAGTHAGGSATGGGAGKGGSANGGSANGGTANGGSTNTGGAPAGGGGSGGDSAGAAGSADFDARCKAAGVVRCVDFDAASELAGNWGDNSAALPGDATPEIDTGIKASGAGSIKFTIPANSGSNSSGSYFTNFSDDLSVHFDGDSDFFVQWRQRFSPEFIQTYYDGGGGWKQAIIGAGDHAGCTASTAINVDQGGNCTSSCTALETVVQNTEQRGFAQMYNSCSGSTSHGPYDPFEEPFGTYDFKLQNARPSPFCLYSQGQSSPTTYFPPDGNCFGYSPNEWMTFQVEVQTGTRVGDEYKNSHVRLWIAREGKASEPVLDWGPYNLTAADPSQGLSYGKVWLLPYHTGKSSAQTNPVAYTWYDELIVSTVRIADPS